MKQYANDDPFITHELLITFDPEHLSYSTYLTEKAKNSENIVSLLRFTPNCGRVRRWLRWNVK
jgi:hypothetical protein